MRGDGSGEARTELLAGKRGWTKARRTQISYNPAHGHRTDTARDPTPHSPTAPFAKVRAKRSWWSASSSFLKSEHERGVTEFAIAAVNDVVKSFVSWVRVAVAEIGTRVPAIRVVDAGDSHATPYLVATHLLE